MAPASILHVLRAPVGGLFRHVCDLALEQSDRGHAVGIVCAATGDALTDQKLAVLAPRLSLGVHRLPIARSVGLADLSAARAVRRLVSALSPDVLHGHGAKGGAYARLAHTGSAAGPVCLYTPHGGSLHYDPATLQGRVVARVERWLEARTDGLLFESSFAHVRYRERFGPPRCAVRVVPNGVGPADLTLDPPAADASDLVFVGELRQLKGVDVLLHAIALVRSTRSVTATIVGDGPDAGAFKTLASELALAEAVTFTGALPGAVGLRRGRTFVLPSRAESLPYVLLEAGGRGLPIIATAVGGVPDLLHGTGTPLVEAGDARALAAAILDTLGDPLAAQSRAEALRARIATAFTTSAMADGVLAFYAALAASRRSTSKPPRPLVVGP